MPQSDNNNGVRLPIRSLPRLFSFVIAFLTVSFGLGFLYSNIMSTIDNIAQSGAESSKLLSDMARRETARNNTNAIFHANISNQVQNNKNMNDLIQSTLADKLDELLEKVDAL